MIKLTPRDYQVQAIRSVWRKFFIDGHQSCLLQAPTGSGKCFAEGTPILLADGRIIPVEQVRTGNVLAGPNGSRTVTSTNKGTEEMFRVTPVKGMAYTVNRSHILSLRMSAAAGGHTGGDIVNLTVDQYLHKSKDFRRVAKGWRAPMERFSCETAELSIPPYILGLWLGDGTSLLPAITSMDNEVIEAWSDYAKDAGAFIRACDANGTRCPTYAISYGNNGCRRNAVLDLLRDHNLVANKHIPHVYKTSSIANRLELLAGIIDTDGYLTNGNYDLVFKQEGFAEDVCFVARSVGLAAYMKRCTKGIKSSGFTGDYYRISISGDTDMIPCRVPRRKASPRKQIKNVLNTGIMVESVGEGEYFGFTLDGPDRLFFLGDFTVVHNTAASSFLVAQLLAHKGIKTLCLAHRREIVSQTAKRLRDDGLSTGIIMAGELYTPDRDIQVGSVDTLDAWVKRNKIEVPDIGMLWIDEAHRAMGSRYQHIIDAYQERGALIFGTTATPIRTDGVGLGRSFDVMVCTPGIKWHIDNGFLVPIQYRVGIVPSTKGIKLTAGDYNAAQLQAVMNQKLLIGNIVENWKIHAEGRLTMVFASGVEHSIGIVQEFMNAGIPAAHIDGTTPTEIREKIAMDLLLGKIKVVSNAQVYVEGTDIPWVSCIVLAQPTKSVGKYLQMGGRGLRPYAIGGKKDLVVLDHAGAVNAHGRIEKDREWHLTTGKEMLEKLASEKAKSKVEFTCRICGTLHTGAICPTCNAKVSFTGVLKDYLPATLVDLSQAEFDKLSEAKPKPKKKTEYTIEDKRDWFAQIRGYAMARGKTEGWCSHTYKDKFGVWPNGIKDVAPKTPGDEVNGFIRHKNIAYAKSRAQERVRA